MIEVSCKFVLTRHFQRQLFKSFLLCTCVLLIKRVDILSLRILRLLMVGANEMRCASFYIWIKTNVSTD